MQSPLKLAKNSKTHFAGCKLVSRLFCMGLFIAMGDCGGAPRPQPAASQSISNIAPSTPFRIVTLSARSLAPADPRDPRPVLEAMVHLDVYTLELPMGTVSGSDAFWKRVDEQAVGVNLADRLSRSGIRCGTAPKSEGLFFSRFLDQRSNQSRLTTVDTIRPGTIELDLKKTSDEQCLFFINSKDQSQGRTYEKSSNNFSLSFGPTPRVAGSVRLNLCPVVTSEQQRMEFTPTNEEYETPAQMVDRLYDISMNVDLTDDSFFIVAPSVDAARGSSIGGRFLIDQKNARQLEQVLVIVPTILRLDGKPMTIRSPMVNALPGKPATILP